MQNSLLIHGGALGDFVLSLRIVAALRDGGACRVTLLGRSEYAELARHGGVDDVLDLHTGGCHALFSDDVPLSGEQTKRFAQFDIAIDMLGGIDSPLHRNLRRIGIPRVLSIDPRPRAQWTGHITDQWLDDLRTSGLNTHVGPPRIVLERSKLEAARTQFARTTGVENPITVIHPGSGSRDKCWPLDRFVQVIDQLRAQAWDVAVVIGPVELERFDAPSLARLRSAAPTIEDCPLDQLAALIAAADLFIGNDSGVSHLAAALRAPMIAIFGPTDPRLWRPLGDRVAVVKAVSGNWPEVMDILAAIRTISSKSGAP